MSETLKKRKPRTNDNGDGSLIPVNGYWRFQIGYTQDGVPKKFTKYVGKFSDVSEKEARKAAKVHKRQFEADLQSANGQSIHDINVTCDVLIKQYQTYLDQHRPKSARDMKSQLQGPLLKFFEKKVARELTSAHIEAYQTRRQNAGKSNGTINRELAGLKAALYKEADRKPSRISRNDIPKWKNLPENAPRQGFLDFDGYDKVLESLPASLKIPFVIGYHGGMRLSEVLNIRWRDVDFETGFVRLPDSKSGNPRSLPFYHQLRPVLLAHRQYCLKHCPVAEFVCVWRHDDLYVGAAHGGKRRTTGDKIHSFYGTWRPAVERAGHKGLLFHDLRRSAVRNMVTVIGIPESQAMLISGHETNSMLKRYNIILPQDLLNTGARMDAFMKEREKNQAEARASGGAR